MKNHPKHADIAALIETLLDADVVFIVVGGAAAILHGASTTTTDLDIVHQRTPKNVDRFLEVLTKLDACYRDPAGRNLVPSRDILLGKGQLNLSTALGPLDPLCMLHDGRSYEELVPHTVIMNDGIHRMHVIDLPTLIQIKSTTGRAKDRLIIPILGALLTQEQNKK